MTATPASSLKFSPGLCAVGEATRAFRSAVTPAMATERYRVRKPGDYFGPTQDWWFKRRKVLVQHPPTDKHPGGTIEEVEVLERYV